MSKKDDNDSNQPAILFSLGINDIVVQKNEHKEYRRVKVDQCFRCKIVPNGVREGEVHEVS